MLGCVVGLILAGFIVVSHSWVSELQHRNLKIVHILQAYPFPSTAYNSVSAPVFALTLGFLVCGSTPVGIS